jgi:hypothetical protein
VYTRPKLCALWVGAGAAAAAEGEGVGEALSGGVSEGERASSGRARTGAGAMIDMRKAAAGWSVVATEGGVVSGVGAMKDMM